ncbi:DUF4037 domain-containing protein [Evansella halocellulosilytica]|uniref:DUF4037 domain-containing protein n=1 Tax=Evansella halocellulosilytica TaxID=2011013 RepID=UPI000BB85333|nr:DUF4037 domain-containing protein [Evansella halocellulosilytica]
MKLNVIAKHISKEYIQNQKVDAVILTGSVSRNWEDEYSDIELFLLWKESPTDEERMKVIYQVNGRLIDFYPYEEEEWSESYVSQGIKLEMSHFLTKTIEKVVHDVTHHFHTDLDKQCLVAAIRNGVLLEERSTQKAIQTMVRGYPDRLTDAMIKEYSDLGTRWGNREALLEREDWLLLYKVIVSVQEHLMAILFSLNKMYVHHPGFKWQKHSLLEMKIKPRDAYNRFESILLNHPKRGLRELEVIVQEVFELVRKVRPSLDVSEAIERSLLLRPKGQ